MSRWRQVALLAKREFKERATSKPFLITMSVLVLVILAVGPAVNFFVSDETEATRIGLVGDEPAGIDQALDAQAAVFEIEIELVRYPDRAAAETALTDGDVAVVLADGTEIVFHTDVSSRLSALVGGAVNTSVKSEALADLGLSDGEVAAVVAPVPVTVVTLEEEDVEEDTKRAAAFVGTLALYISILMFGQFVAMGTVEEKQNRVVEVILSRVRPWQILVGKVVGIGLLGLLQLGAAGRCSVLLGADGRHRPMSIWPRSVSRSSRACSSGSSSATRSTRSSMRRSDQPFHVRRICRER